MEGLPAIYLMRGSISGFPRASKSFEISSGKGDIVGPVGEAVIAATTGEATAVTACGYGDPSYM